LERARQPALDAGVGLADITAVKPDARVKRGLARTFQINALFPHLNALEAVTLAVCERRGVSREWWKPLPAYGEAVEEAYAILGSLMLAADCYRLTRELAYGQQRLLEIALALATRPRACSPSRGCAPATGKPWCSTTSRSRFPSTAAWRCSAATASASRRCCSASWATPR